MRYKSFDPEAKVIGQAVLGFKAAANQEMIQPLLEKYGLTDILPDQWYPLQKWLDVLSDISEQGSDYASMITFVNIGQKVAASVQLPEEMLALGQSGGIIEFATSVQAGAYHQDHQGNVGSITVEKIDPKHLRTTVKTPYPPDFLYGIQYGFAKRFGESFVIHYEDIAMRNYPSDKAVIIHLIVE